MMIAFGLTCSAGGSTLFSVFVGRKNRDNMDRSFGTAFILVIIFELLLTAALLLFTDPSLKVFGVTGISYDYALTYYRIAAWEEAL